MRKPFCASAFVLGLGVNSVAADGFAADPSTWRWATSMALDAQRGSEPAPVVAQARFRQRHERYSYNGQIDAQR